MKEAKNMNLDEFIKSLPPIDLPEEENTITSDISYFDENGKTVSKEEATFAIITEYDQSGNLINETWGEIGNKEETSKRI